ncbi:phage portal protein [Orbus mooreae]|uniref:phage portal protein n=1 Tax=Orbus mooreae TaxID=3074107 RepID=UPI00370D4CDE
MRFIEKCIGVFSPEAAFKRTLAVEKTKMLSQQMGIIRGGQTYTGASNKRSLKDWFTHDLDANSSILTDLPLLRSRSQDLYNNSPAAAGAIKNIKTNVIGVGLLMRSVPDSEYIGLSDDESQAWSDIVEREFEMWSDNALFCDYNGQQSFKEMQRLIILSQQISGDVFVLMPWVNNKNSIYDLKLKIVDAARVCNPNDAPDNKQIAGGVEYDDYGRPIAIHIRTPHPGNQLDFSVAKWDRIEIWGKESGRRNVLHIMEHERIDQARGVPALTPVIETVKQISKYSEAEINAAVINAVLSVFIERSNDDSAPGGSNYEEDDDSPKPWEESEQSLGSGTLIDLAPGEKANMVSAVRPSSQFDPFFLATMKQIGMALEIPFEVLIKHFSSSYSAARAALLEANKMYREKRSFFVDKFCKPVFEEFLTEAIIKGRVNAPGFLSDLAIRSAYLKTAWTGPAPGQLDPIKEYEASNKACEYGFSHRSKETAELNGLDFEDVIKAQAREKHLMKKHGVELQTSIYQPIADDKSTNSDDDNNKEIN